MKVFINSCHAALEYDQAVMFLSMGHQVAGNFDTGSKQRPKIEGVTNVSHDLKDALFSADLLVLHQCDNYSMVFKQCCDERGKRPVVLNYFGQGCDEQHRHVVSILSKSPNAYVVCYSRKEERMFRELGVPENKFRMIRFGKVLEEFRNPGWNGKLPIAYMSCNSIERRGEGCGWPAAKRLMDSVGVPLLLSGKDTETLTNGIGELDYEGIKSLYRNVRCFVSLGTKPAPLVLTQIEAMMTGCPVIVLNNGCGIADEKLPVFVCNTVEDVVQIIHELCGDSRAASASSLACKQRVEDEFSMVKVISRWEMFMKEMISTFVGTGEYAKRR